MRPLGRLASMLLLCLVAACRDSADPPGARPRATGSPASVSHPCPVPSGVRQPWPGAAPAGLPVPPGLRVLDTRQQGSVLVVQFSTGLSLPEAGRYVVEELPRAGFALRRGDAEGDEIDQPFTGHGFRGSFKLRGVSACHTDGTLVSTRAAT